MMKFATIRVPMTTFDVDVLIGGDADDYEKFSIERYGLEGYDAKMITEDEVSTIESDENSHYNGDTVFCLKLKEEPKEDIPVFIHELWHLMWHISSHINDFKLSTKTQSWSACMIETLADSILKAKYEEYKA